jgi:4a-hydroxytetrahydrobiopterin dehydratase
MAIEPLADDQLQDALRGVPEWGESGGGGGNAIQRTYRFKDFIESMKFVNAVADAAEKSQHHPDILVRWNKVTLTLSTHDAGNRVTAKDFDLARQCDGFAASLGVAAHTAAPAQEQRPAKKPKK